MTKCNRCGNEFDNFFSGMHWCPFCGKVFAFDENILKKEKKKDDRKNIGSDKT